MIDLTSYSSPELVGIFNVLTSSAVARFESQEAGIRRIERALREGNLDDAHLADVIERALPGKASKPILPAVTVIADAVVAPVEPVIETKAPAVTTGPGRVGGDEAEVTGDEPAAVSLELDDTDRRILAMLAAMGPCKIGAMRTRWIAEDGTFARLAPTQQKGMMRRSVRRLEGAGKVKKYGMIFSLPAA